MLDFSPGLLLESEIAAALLGVLAVWLLARGDGRGWPLGVLTLLLSFWVYLNESIYGAAGLQIAFLILQVVGWWRWARGTEPDLRLSSRLLTTPRRAGLSAGWVGSSMVLSLLLTRGGSQFVPLDSFATVGSLIGQALMVAGFAEAWLVYLVVDAVYVAVSLQASLNFLAIMYLVYCLLACQGWWEWTRDHRAKKRNDAPSP